MLEQHPSNCIGIFSHAHTLRALHAIALNRFNATEREYQLAYDTLRIDNGGICIFEYGKAHKSESWWWHIVSWNETGHLL
jgi:broad specificity phosphatase PhoE